MKKHYYNLVESIIGISILVIVIILFSILIFVFKEFTIMDIFKFSIALAFILYLCNNLPGYVAFSEDYLIHKKNALSKAKFIDYYNIDKVNLDFEAAMWGMNWIYFKNDDKIILAIPMTVKIVKDILKQINKRKIYVKFDINSKWFNLPKKYHSLLYTYLSPKDKKAFDEKYGEEYSKNLND